MTVNTKISTKNATKATKGAVAAARQAIIKARIQAVQQYLPTHAALFRPFGSIENRDAVAMMRDLPDAFVDSVVTDPPYGINMAAWDGQVPGVEVWREAYRVLKPGAFCVVAAAGRTYDETAQALRAAGFEVRDMLVWRYTQSFPASKGLGGEWRSGLKNNQEPWVVAQKPKERGLTLTQNWLIHCTGAVRTGAVGSGDWRSNVIHCAKPKPWERDLGCVPGKIYVQPAPPKSGARSNSSNGQNWHPTVKPLGDHRDVAMRQQLSRHRLGRGAKVQDQAAIVRDRCRAGPCDGRLRAFVHPPPRLIAEIRDPGPQDRPAMHPVQMACVGKVRQVAPDRLQRHVEARGKVLDHHPAVGPGQLQNPGLAEVQRHRSVLHSLRFGFLPCHAPAVSGFFAFTRGSAARRPSMLR